jgi:tRNA pseudouridine38-40 synthase
VHPFWAEAALEGGEASKEDDMRRKRCWRVGADDLERLRETVRKFEATHNFHNFTIGREFVDRSNQRHMKTIEVSVFPFMRRACALGGG